MRYFGGILMRLFLHLLLRLGPLLTAPHWLLIQMLLWVMLRLMVRMMRLWRRSLHSVDPFHLGLLHLLHLRHDVRRHARGQGLQVLVRLMRPRFGPSNEGVNDRVDLGLANDLGGLLFHLSPARHRHGWVRHQTSQGSKGRPPLAEIGPFLWKRIALHGRAEKAPKNHLILPPMTLLKTYLPRLKALGFECNNK